MVFGEALGHYTADPARAIMRQARSKSPLLELELDQDKALIGERERFELNYETCAKTLERR